MVLVSLVITVSLGVAAVALGPYVYKSMVTDESKVAPAITTNSQSSNQPDDIDGTWLSKSGSYAGYRVEEVLRGVDVTVVGRTEQVTSTLTVVDKVATSGTVTVDVASIKTGVAPRDSYFRDSITESKKYPTAIFTLTKPIDLSNLKSGSSVKLHGNLTLHGVTKDLKVTAQVGSNETITEVAGTIPVTWSDYDIVAPNLGFVTVEESGFIEFYLQLSR